MAGSRAAGIVEDGRMIKFAFYGRVSTEDEQDPQSSRSWQLARSRALIGSRGGVIVAEFFDVDKSRSVPWQRRPRAAALLAELRSKDRGFAAVVVGGPYRAFYGNQYGLTFPLFEHYGVPLWVPEVGGPVDPRNEAHDLVMSVFGGMSKGERNRVKVRVHAAMGAQAREEGRFLGGRPPYGYLIADAGPHPNPAKAADGKRLHKLGLDPEAVPVVRRIFAEFTAGHGYCVIAEALTRDAIPSPSAHDPERNKHRSGIAWSKSAVRAILANPRYTGHQVCNKQRKDEVLIDGVTLGHVTRLRWNDAGKWLWSKEIVQPPVIGREAFDQVQAMIARRAQALAARKPHRAQHPYALRGCLWCALCGRRMQGHWANGTAYYRCRFPADYALPSEVQHPRSVYLRENQVLGQVDAWLARELAPHRLSQAIRALPDAQPGGSRASQAPAEAAAKIAECNRKLARYRAALDAGASPATVAGWITETEAEKARYVVGLRQSAKAPERMTEQEISSITGELAAAAREFASAGTEDKSEIFRQLGLKLTYHPGRKVVEASIEPARHGLPGMPGKNSPRSPWLLATEFALRGGRA
jgi:site-specific DNA recombinase